MARDCIGDTVAYILKIIDAADRLIQRFLYHFGVRFAALQQVNDLLKLVPDLIHQKNADPIAEEGFAQRITLSELSLTYEGDFTAYFDDDDMFWGHTVEVCGSLENGIESANIAG